jgi:hypothetical protein
MIVGETLCISVLIGIPAGKDNLLSNSRTTNPEQGSVSMIDLSRDCPPPWWMFIAWTISLAGFSPVNPSVFIRRSIYL